jgi:prepilin-type N-terminal cleavage/methylation domain-containing protein
MKKIEGFSLIELLIVVAIILVIAAIAIPALLRARIAANESSAASAVRTLTSAQIQYQTSYPGVGYASSINALSGTSCATPTSAAACLIDQAIANATSSSSAKSGYVYAGTGANLSFSVGNYPLQVQHTGRNSYCAFEDSVVRVDTTGAPGIATACAMSVSPLQN